jgi:hypothetical protein
MKKKIGVLASGVSVHVSNSCNDALGVVRCADDGVVFLRRNHDCDEHREGNEEELEGRHDDRRRRKEEIARGLKAQVDCVKMQLIRRRFGRALISADFCLGKTARAVTGRCVLPGNTDRVVCLCARKRHPYFVVVTAKSKFGCCRTGQAVGGCAIIVSESLISYREEERG